MVELNNIENLDLIKVTTKDDTFQGQLMPRPELLNDDTYVLKLESGYNIGILKDNVVSIELIEKYQEREEKKEEVSFNPELPTVAVVSTGGTISSKIDYKTGGVKAAYDANDLLAMCPEIKEFTNLKAIPLMSVMSEDMTLNEHSEIAKKVKELNEDDSIEGIVITQGTDTMHFTTAALSFMCGKLNKPVIVTGSQKSVDRGSSDGFMNLICSCRGAIEDNLKGVFLCMHGTINDDFCYLHYGTKVRKMHTTRRDAFRSINQLPKARVWFDKVEILTEDKLDECDIFLDESHEENVGLINVYPGMKGEQILYFKEKNYKGLVIAGTALGHVPESIMRAIKELIESGIEVVIATQTLYGKTNEHVYSRLREEAKLGCIFVKDMMPEVAYVKLACVLGKTKEHEKVKELMLTNIAHELNEVHTKEMFLN